MWVTKTLPQDVAFLVFVHFIGHLLIVALHEGLVPVNAGKDTFEKSWHPPEALTILAEVSLLLI
ncbi:hypothetical protein [Bacillus sp. JJ1562]|uniref:hypothetical protein n=1 Tax=Bacillus sp. JJ1562 TaxID=3122960 RepID=UPI0030038E10